MGAIAEPRTDQREQARQFANVVRERQKSARQSLKHMTRREGGLLAAQMLLERHDEIASMRLYVFLESVPRLARAGTKAILVRHGIYAAKRVGELTERQRRVLAGELVEFANGGWR